MTKNIDSNTYLAILGRQPEIGMAELLRVYGNATPIADYATAVNTPSFNINRLGGTIKAGVLVAEFGPSFDKVSQKIAQHYIEKWKKVNHKVTLGVSVYIPKVTPKKAQQVGLIIKNELKKHGVSIRLIPNKTSALSSATSHNNRLGLSQNKVEILIVLTKDNRILVAESNGAQNITAYTKRDQKRPKRDAFVGMLPPKLAQIIINLAVGQNPISEDFKILDPFCGTGVILQEANLMGFGTLGSDLNPKMTDYTQQNLEWLKNTHRSAKQQNIWLKTGDAVDTVWPKFNTIAAETYLGRPFSSPPSKQSLSEVSRTCSIIISNFLINASKQMENGTEFCIAIPAWRLTNGKFYHLSLKSTLEAAKLEELELSKEPLLYHREDQIVARQLLVLKKK